MSLFNIVLTTTTDYTDYIHFMCSLESVQKHNEFRETPGAISCCFTVNQQRNFCVDFQ